MFDELDELVDQFIDDMGYSAVAATTDVFPVSQGDLRTDLRVAIENLLQKNVR